MKKMQVTIEKMHYEPYPIKDMITAWEVEYTVEYDAATEFLSSLRNNISRLKKLFDTKSEWNYEIANADINLDGYPLVVNEETLETTRDNVYAGGDAVTGAATVILAMGAGKQAAASIHEKLSK